jgi:hypothetical protein
LLSGVQRYKLFLILQEKTKKYFFLFLSLHLTHSLVMFFSIAGCKDTHSFAFTKF